MTRKASFRLSFVVIPSKSDAADTEQSPALFPGITLCYFKRHCRFGLTDVTGCNERQVSLALMNHDSPAERLSSFYFNHFCSEAEMMLQRECDEKVNINTRINLESVGWTEEILQSYQSAFKRSSVEDLFVFISVKSPETNTCFYFWPRMDKQWLFEEAFCIFGENVRFTWW